MSPTASGSAPASTVHKVALAILVVLEAVWAFFAIALFELMRQFSPGASDAGSLLGLLLVGFVVVAPLALVYRKGLRAVPHAWGVFLGLAVLFFGLCVSGI